MENKKPVLNLDTDLVINSKINEALDVLEEVCVRLLQASSISAHAKSFRVHGHLDKFYQDAVKLNNNVFNFLQVLQESQKIAVDKYDEMLDSQASISGDGTTESEST